MNYKSFLISMRLKMLQRLHLILKLLTSLLLLLLFWIYSLILNLMPAVCSKKTWTGATKDWESWGMLTNTCWSIAEVNRLIVTRWESLLGWDKASQKVIHEQGWGEDHLVNNCVSKQSNSLGTMFLNMQLERTREFPHLQSIISLIYSEILEKSLHVSNKA